MELQWKKAREDGELAARERDGLVYLSFPALEETGLAVNGFSTRHGGVSTGCYATMNLSFTREDPRENVEENYRRMAAALGVDREKMVLSWQTHTVNVRQVTEADWGKGITRERDYRDVDGLITDVPGTTLVTFYADCVPLYLLDPVHKAIGLSHSGWRGTVKRMGQVTLEAMGRAYGTRPQDVIACVGPSICKDCFEVGGEVAQEFRQAFRQKDWDSLIRAGERPGKFQVDLWRANELVFLEADVKPENIHVTNICTKCNPDHLYSHRVMGTERGNLAAFLGLR